MIGLCRILQSYTFMSHIFGLPHERTFQLILMCFLVVIHVRNNEPPEQLGYSQKHHTTKPTSYTLWPIWSCFVVDMVVADVVCGRYGIGPWRYCDQACLLIGLFGCVIEVGVSRHLVELNSLSLTWLAWRRHSVSL